MELNNQDVEFLKVYKKFNDTLNRYKNKLIEKNKKNDVYENMGFKEYFKLEKIYSQLDSISKNDISYKNSKLLKTAEEKLDSFRVFIYSI